MPSCLTALAGTSVYMEQTSSPSPELGGSTNLSCSVLSSIPNVLRIFIVWTGHNGPPQGIHGSAGSWSLWSVLGLLATLPASSCAVVAFRCTLGWPLCSWRDCAGPSRSRLCATLPPPRSPLGLKGDVGRGALGQAESSLCHARLSLAFLIYRIREGTAYRIWWGKRGLLNN